MVEWYDLVGRSIVVGLIMLGAISEVLSVGQREITLSDFVFPLLLLGIIWKVGRVSRRWKI